MIIQKDSFSLVIKRSIHNYIIALIMSSYIQSYWRNKYLNTNWKNRLSFTQFLNNSILHTIVRVRVYNMYATVFNNWKESNREKPSDTEHTQIPIVYTELRELSESRPYYYVLLIHPQTNRLSLFSLLLQLGSACYVLKCMCHVNISHDNKASGNRIELIWIALNWEWAEVTEWIGIYCNAKGGWAIVWLCKCCFV